MWLRWWGRLNASCSVSVHGRSTSPGKECEWFGDCGVVLNEATIIIAKSQETFEVVSWWWSIDLISDSCGFSLGSMWINPFRRSSPEIPLRRCGRYTFSGFGERLLSRKTCKTWRTTLSIFCVRSGLHQNVVHIDCYYAFTWLNRERCGPLKFWNVAGEFVSPKNITVGSNSPLFIENAAFHSSPSFMRILLLAPSYVRFWEDSKRRWHDRLIHWWVRGSGYWFLMVVSLIFR